MYIYISVIVVHTYYLVMSAADEKSQVQGLPSSSQPQGLQGHTVDASHLADVMRGFVGFSAAGLEGAEVCCWVLLSAL
jgi:hypothetical protein